MSWCCWLIDIYDLETCIVSMNISYLMVCKTNVPGEEDCQPITAELDFDALGQFLQWWEVIGGEVVGQSYMELLLMRLHVDFWSWKTRQEFDLHDAVCHTNNNQVLNLQRLICMIIILWSEHVQIKRCSRVKLHEASGMKHAEENWQRSTCAHQIWMAHSNLFTIKQKYDRALALIWFGT